MPNHRSMRGARKSQPSAGEMPMKRTRRRRKAKGGIDSIGVFPSSRRDHFPATSRRRLWFSSKVFAYTTTGAGSGDYQFYIYANSLYQPWNTGLMSGITPNGSGISFSTLQPVGFSTWCNANFYRAYRVLGAGISIVVTPQSVTDSVVVAIAPSTNVGDVAHILGQKYSVEATHASGRPTGSKGCNIFLPLHKILGVSAAAIRDDLSYNYCGTYNTKPVDTIGWACGIETGDNAVLSQPLEVRIELCFHVELFGLTGLTTPISIRSRIGEVKEVEDTDEMEGVSQSLSRLGVGGVPPGRAPDGDHMLHKIALDNTQGYLVVGADPAVLRTLRKPATCS
jgi:hypothetical protein